MRRSSSFRALTIVLVALFASPVSSVLAATKTTSTWKAADLQPAAYRKLAVVAKIDDDLARRILEDAVVAGLEKLGVVAVASYQVFTAEDLADEESLAKKVEELGIDAGLVFTVLGEQKEVKSGPTVHASVGVPVRAGPFSMFLGTSVPLGGGSSTKTTVSLKSAFYTVASEGPLWIANYATDLKGGTEQAAEQVAAQALKQVKKAKLFSK